MRKRAAAMLIAHWPSGEPPRGRLFALIRVILHFARAEKLTLMPLVIDYLRRQLPEKQNIRRRKYPLAHKLFPSSHERRFQQASRPRWLRSIIHCFSRINNGFTGIRAGGIGK